MKIDPFLQDLEERIDDQEETRLYGVWQDFAKGSSPADVFSPQRSRKNPPLVNWPDLRINQCLDDEDAMILSQYKFCSDSLVLGNGQLMCVRSNYGSGIIPLLFGAELFIMDEKFNTLPTAKPCNKGPEYIRALIESGVPDIKKGYGAKVFRMGEKFMEIKHHYPKIGKYVHIYHPDCQGPLDICEMVWGSTIFLDAIDKPDLIKQMLEVITQTYIVFMNEWKRIVPFEPEVNVHWNMLHRGNIMLRDDSAMNFSPEMFTEFVAPYDQRLLNEFDGGAIHFCGKGDHYIHHIGKMQKIYAVNLTQPEYNNMEIIYRNTVDKDIRLIGLSRNAVDDAQQRGRMLHGKAQTWPAGE